MEENRHKKERFYLLDIMRGFTVLHMICYHALYDLVFIYDVDIAWYRSEIGHIWQQYICWSFIFISGICWSFGKNNLKRGVFLFSLGMLLTIGTAIIMPEELIVFGILHFLGLAILLLIPLKKFLKKFPPMLGLLLSFFFFFVLKNIDNGYLGFEGMNLWKLPQWLYQSKYIFFLGFPAAGFRSSDYFPVFPWIFLFLSGFFFWKSVGNKEWIQAANKIRIPFLEFIGRHAIWFYMLHQPVIMGMLMFFIIS